MNIKQLLAEISAIIARIQQHGEDSISDQEIKELIRQLKNLRDSRNIIPETNAFDFSILLAPKPFSTTSVAPKQTTDFPSLGSPQQTAKLKLLPFFLSEEFERLFKTSDFVIHCLPQNPDDFRNKLEEIGVKIEESSNPGTLYQEKGVYHYGPHKPIPNLDSCIYVKDKVCYTVQFMTLRACKVPTIGFGPKYNNAKAFRLPSTTLIAFTTGYGKPGNPDYQHPRALPKKIIYEPAVYLAPVQPLRETILPVDGIFWDLCYHDVKFITLCDNLHLIIGNKQFTLTPEELVRIVY